MSSVVKIFFLKEKAQANSFPEVSWQVVVLKQPSTSKTSLMHVKLGTTDLGHLRKFKPILVQLRNSKHFENMKELNHMSCLR